MFVFWERAPNGQGIYLLYSVIKNASNVCKLKNEANYFELLFQLTVCEFKMRLNFIQLKIGEKPQENNYIQ